MIAFIVRAVLRRWMTKESGAGSPKRQALVHDLPRSAGFAAFLLTIGIGVRSLEIPSELAILTKHILPFMLGMLGVAVAMRIVLRSISAYGEAYPQLVSTARVLTWALGCGVIAVLVSDAVGISLAPALTALGIGSLSVALALQDTLANFFAGIYLLIGRHVRPNDFVRVDGGYEGYVTEIGWRSTHLRTLAPSTVIVPNSTMSKAVITNFGTTNPRLLLATSIDVSLDEDPVRASAVLDDVAKGSIDLPGVQAKPAPYLRMAFDERGLAFTVYVTVDEQADTGFVQQELRKRALERLRKEGIKLAPPVRLV